MPPTVSLGLFGKVRIAKLSEDSKNDERSERALVVAADSRLDRSPSVAAVYDRDTNCVFREA